MNWFTDLPLAYTHNTPPQVGEYISYNPSLLHNKPKQVLYKALVNISAIWTLAKTYEVAIRPPSNICQVKWESTSICLVC